MSFESTRTEVITSDPMDDRWERGLDERTPFDQMGDWWPDSPGEVCAELPF